MMEWTYQIHATHLEFEFDTIHPESLIKKDLKIVGLVASS